MCNKRYRVCSPRTYPKFSGDYQEAARSILEDSSIGPNEFAFGVSKIFIKHPEVVFSLEEQRERKLFDYAIKIQDFFDRYVGSNNYFYQLRVNGNNIVKGHKERNRLSLGRPFRTDYINFKENYTLPAIVERYGSFFFFNLSLNFF